MFDVLLVQFFDYLSWSLARVEAMTPWQLLALYSSFLLFDTPRYVLSKCILLLIDFTRELYYRIHPEIKREELMQSSLFLPFVTVICPGKNEEHTMPHTIRSLLAQDYPYMEIIAIDDGSSDGTWQAISQFKDEKIVRLHRRLMAGGKSSAANMGLNLSVKGDIIVIVDSDSIYAPDAIRHMVSPFADSRVGAVSGNLKVTNWDHNFITRFQAVDYMHSISLGRRLTSAAGTLAICSGAFGAFRRTAVEAVGGWDVGPGEDGDLTIKIRKLGYKVVFAPEATCYTKVPDTWRAWWKQRRRWSRGVVRYKMRKHFDMAIPGSDSFSFTNMLVVLDVAFFRIFLLYSFWFYFIWLLLFCPEGIPLVMIVSFTAYTLSSMVQMSIQLYYSHTPLLDFEIMLYAFLMYPYRFLEKTIRLISVTEEFLFRRSYEDKYVPRRVGRETIHW